MLYHYNKETGRTGECDASVRDCPLGGPGEHFTTEQEARQGYEAYMQEHLISPPMVKDKLKDMDANDLALELLQRMPKLGIPEREVSDILELASILHAGQKRRARVDKVNLPYIEHPLRVSIRLMRAGCQDKDVIRGALLHDTVEDCSQTFVRTFLGKTMSEPEAREVLFTYISRKYNARAARMVHGVTNEYVSGADARSRSPEEKNAIYLGHLRSSITDNPGTMVIKLSDFVDNAVGLQPIPGQESRVRKQARKYLPCISLFQEELRKPGVPLPDKSIEHLQQQLRRAENRLANLAKE